MIVTILKWRCIMSRIKIKDIPKDQKICKEDMRNVYGGGDSLLCQLPVFGKLPNNITNQAIIRKIGESDDTALEDTALAVIRKLGEAE